MAVSENYVPQSENLEHLECIIRELQEESFKGSLLKNKVVSAVDSLIEKLNGDKGADHTAVIDKLEKFLARYSDMVERDTAPEPRTQLQQLQDQNRRLKQVLASRRAYNQEAAIVNGEFEEGIAVLMDLVRDRKEKDDTQQFAVLKTVADQVQELRQKEWTAYEKLIKNENIIWKLARIITDFYGFLADETSGAAQAEELRAMATFYEAKIGNKKDSYKLMRPEVTDLLFTDRGR